MLETENLRLSDVRTQAEKVPQTFSLRRGLGELTDVYEIVWEKLQGLK
ncbi:phosphoribosylaminoimidazolesuccinocarboxamide synthase [Streptococcus oralis]|uniref:Phosphoribosylaminoimidazolesuccinocarboxamide synthase n=1 Tax=Streptococcus oralis subsp. tigurinus TaxID=1077464 RepID=A0A1X1GCX6_STROR|nr:phosphoribosylaminoimidazolesuccinocarboxamide synthase [Streptococcus oralis subsp. tigurinus]ORO49956.1 phosphoribosylaminoimidazolesuccinocarboxamide synthase [Streptococcus oralis subsp. tigurinus]